MNKKYHYVLKVVNKDMKSSHGFKYPRRGRCTAPDWARSYNCGHGLHGWLNGEGYTGISGFDHVDDPTHNWLVIKVEDGDLIELDGKCKFRTGYVVFCGKRDDAIKYLTKKNSVTPRTNWQKYKAGYGARKVIGDYSTISCGDQCRIMCGSRCTVDLGHYGKLMAGAYCRINTERACSIETKWFCILKCGNNSNISCHDNCIIETGHNSIVRMGYESKVKAKDGTIIIHQFDNKTEIAKVGEDLKPNVWYSYNIIDNKWFEIKEQLVLQFKAEINK